jgi:hypothetical protein
MALMAFAAASESVELGRQVEEQYLGDLPLI